MRPCAHKLVTSQWCDALLTGSVATILRHSAVNIVKTRHRKVRNPLQMQNILHGAQLQPI